MTGPEHYREAERLLRDEYRTAESIAAAQVHATLALAATHALTQPVCTDTADGSGHATKADWDAWVKVAGVAR